MKIYIKLLILIIALNIQLNLYANMYVHNETHNEIIIIMGGGQSSYELKYKELKFNQSIKIPDDIGYIFILNEIESFKESIKEEKYQFEDFDNSLLHIRNMTSNDYYIGVWHVLMGTSPITTLNNNKSMSIPCINGNLILIKNTK